jgi:hypothetical protein
VEGLPASRTPAQGASYLAKLGFGGGRARAVRRGDVIHLGLMLAALGVAHLSPFELLLLSYAVLGPAHSPPCPPTHPVTPEGPQALSGASPSDAETSSSSAADRLAPARRVLADAWPR